ncbi:hypothetical protein J2T41_006284 [Pseudomonas citronellolis]|uniref:hypothetical protein n=1 Tax=Pseudomonas citronellolis TaxID=53408 RepID=UPI00209FAB52|nr:hypothetical protein [Pseudomonas citronellolis]MCP1646625.1 hypothetical protein [Pseudomonas citronellolis]MCP1669538.1 hypothetical protein [Pseudomonas citronellolis]MCP1701222.1 hypothetical protein [Pseudomonas citronellolis]MCP1707447.1 hypothetical protein [Pseudomonas citronellolis]MCP1801333.1 hypothetical protein [Pseudomonas citronellolis]
MLRISAVTNLDTTSWRVGYDILSAFSDGDSRLIPESLYQWENKISDFNSVSACEPYWAQVAVMQAQGLKMDFPMGLRWKRKKVVKYDAEINHTHRNIKGDVVEGSLVVEAQYHRKVEWLDVFRNVCSAMRPRYALMHIFSQDEISSVKVGSLESCFSSGVLYQGKIPDIGWAIFCGDDLAGLVDSFRISVAGFSVEELGNGFLIRVTEDLQDVVEDFSLFSRRRAELKSLFKEGYF